MGKFQVSFKRSNGEKVLVDTFEDKAESVKEFEGDIPHFNLIYDYIHKLNPNYTIYYIRSFPSNDKNTLIIDVGSHTEFFHITKI